MSKPTFREVAYALAPAITYSEDMIRITEAVMKLIDDTYIGEVISPDHTAVWTNGRWEFRPEKLVETAYKNFEIMDYVAAGKKIDAIKLLRKLTGCGLKEAKDAIEDPRVWDGKNTNTYGFAEDQI